MSNLGAKTMKNYVLHLAAENDINGNPKRVFVVYDDTGNIVETINEGYIGASAWYKKYPNAISLGRYPTTKSEVRELLKLKPSHTQEVA